MYEMNDDVVISQDVGETEPDIGSAGPADWAEGFPGAS